MLPPEIYNDNGQVLIDGTKEQLEALAHLILAKVKMGDALSATFKCENQMFTSIRIEMMSEDYE